MPDGTIDFSKAYPAQIGDWDKVAINYGYRQSAARRRSSAALDADSGRRVGEGSCAT